MKRQTDQHGIAPLLLIIVLVLLLLGIGGAYYYGSHHLITLPPTGQAIPTSQSSASASVKEDHNLKTYTNTKYNFTLKYPSDFQVKEDTVYPYRVQILAGKDMQSTSAITITPLGPGRESVFDPSAKVKGIREVLFANRKAKELPRRLMNTGAPNDAQQAAPQPVYVRDIQVVNLTGLSWGASNEISYTSFGYDTKIPDQFDQVLRTFTFSAPQVFDPKLILQSFQFTNSQGIKKKLIIYQRATQDGLELADIYLVDDNLSFSSPVLIEALNEEVDTPLGKGFLYSNWGDIKVSVSPGPGKKYIVFSGQGMGDSTELYVLAETGQLIWASHGENSLQAKAMDTVKDKCQCDERFDSWNDNHTFYVKIITAGDGPYRVLLDVVSGNVVGQPQKI